MYLTNSLKEGNLEEDSTKKLILIFKNSSFLGFFPDGTIVRIDNNLCINRNNMCAIIIIYIYSTAAEKYVSENLLTEK